VIPTGSAGNFNLKSSVFRPRAAAGGAASARAASGGAAGHQLELEVESALALAAASAWDSPADVPVTPLAAGIAEAQGGQLPMPVPRGRMPLALAGNHCQCGMPDPGPATPAWQ